MNRSSRVRSLGVASTHLLVRASLALLLTLVAGCGGGSTDGGGGSAAGTASIVLSDEGLDALTAFEVDVTGIVFERVDGAEVGVLPKATRVDFVDLTEVGELVARRTLAPGSFRAVRITFDFSTATVLVAGESTPATLLDGDGSVLTGAVEVPIEFPRTGRPGIQTLRNHVVQLDLDLSQAVEVDVAANRVTFRPVVSAVFDPTDLRPLVGRGRLLSIDSDASTFTLERVARDDSALGEHVIRTVQNTVFQIDGAVWRGSVGLTQLGTLAAGSRVFVQGSFDPRTGELVAAAVEAGLGVPGGGQDQVVGWIVARDNGAGSDATLAVLGNSRDSTGATRTFHVRVEVSVDFGGTTVLQRGTDAVFGTDALQVGQAVAVFGQFGMAGTTLDATSAAQGIVRVLPTDVAGVANGPVFNGALSLDIARIGPLDADRFDFLVGGVQQLDRDALLVDVGTIDGSGVQTDSSVVVSGWFEPLGAGSSNDFAAERLVDRSNAGSLLHVAWPLTGGPTAALSVGNGVLLVDPSAGRVAWTWDGVVRRDVADLPVPSVTAAAAAGLYTIWQSGSLTLHRDFDAFLDDLDVRLAAGGRVLRVGGLGAWDPQLQRLGAATCGITLR